jgi:transposase
MYVRTVTTKGTKYLQLAHNYRDPKTGISKVRVIHSLGRADQLDPEALRRLVRSISRFLEPGDAQQVLQHIDGSPFEFMGSKSVGSVWLLDQVWKRLGIDATLHALLGKRDYATPIERLIFSMVCNRAVNPSSKLAMEQWVAHEVMIDGLPEVEVQQLYRAMDFLLEAADEIQWDVYFGIANLLNLEVDVIFLDTTTTYFETSSELACEQSMRQRGYSKDSRPDLLQVVIGFAMTRQGIPVRCWVWPGNTVDQNAVNEVKHDLNGWKLGRVITVMDAGFSSLENKRVLQGAGDHYIIGEKMRAGSKGKPVDALKRGGRYSKLDNGLETKEVVVGGDSVARQRYVICHNPEEAERDRKKRDDIVADVTRMLSDIRQLQGEPHTKAMCALRSHPVYGRYVKQARDGSLSIDSNRVRQEERFDGKFLISTSDDLLPAEDVAIAYKHLWQIERLNRDLKHVVDVRPVYHRLDQRVRSHVLLCWLALLLIRVIENQCGNTWRNTKSILNRLQVGMHRKRTGEVWQTSTLTEEQREVFAAMNVESPPRYPVLRA